MGAERVHDGVLEDRRALLGPEDPAVADAIEELGESFASESQPMVVDVEGETHKLTGSAEAQYAEWRTLLRKIYASETGLDAGGNNDAAQ